MTPRTGLVAILIALSTSFLLITLPETIMVEQPSAFSSWTMLSYFPGTPAERERNMTRSHVSLLGFVRSSTQQKFTFFSTRFCHPHSYRLTDASEPAYEEVGSILTELENRLLGLGRKC